MGSKEDMSMKIIWLTQLYNCLKGINLLLKISLETLKGKHKAPGLNFYFWKESVIGVL